MKRILVVCEDAGGARALAPVVARLRRRGDRVDLLLGQVARDTFVSDGVVEVAPTDHSLSDLSVAVNALQVACASRPAVVVTASTCWGLRIEARAVLAAREGAIPSVTLIDFPSQLVSRLSFPGTDDFQAAGDLVLAIDVEMQKRLVAAGLPAARVAVTGSPAFDALWDTHDSPPDTSARSGYVLFLSQPIAALFGSHPSEPSFLGYTEKSVLDALAPLVAQHGIDLRVRPHPREDPSGLAALVTALPGRVGIEAKEDLRLALRGAAVVVGMTTVALVEAALLSKPTISVQLNRRGEDPLWTNASGVTIGVTDTDGLARALDRALREPASPARARERMLDLGWAPDAATRVVTRVDALAVG